MTGSILFEAVVFLSGAVVCVPIAKRFGLSSILGYLLAGMLIGPYILGFIGEEGQDILHFAEFGVVMMLFLIGLEIEPKSFWKMRKTIVGLGGAQVLGTILLGYFILTMFGLDWRIALALSMALALSSTAITLQSIKEKGLLNTTYGASSFSILLFQDIVVILMLGVLPLLCTDQSTAVISEHGDSVQSNLLDNLPLGLQTASIVITIIAIIIAGKYLIVPGLRLIASTRVRELLVGAALLIVFGISFLMELVGLSPALGAFLGGVVLANSEFKHELESTLEPFKGLLLGLFFMAVGASINFVVIADNPLFIGGLVIGAVLLKALVLFVVGSIFRLKIDQKLLLVVGLAQIGEFAFVLLSFAFELNILDREQLDIMLVVTALTMTLTPFLSMLNERAFLPRIGTKESEERLMDDIEGVHTVILIGFGHFGSTIGRFLRANGVEATILDQDSNRVDLLRKLGFKVYYGDASRMDLLESAGIADAEILICAIDNPDVTTSIVKKISEKYPKLKLMVRAKNRYDAYDFVNMGVENIYRESLDTSIRLAGDVLHEMGHSRNMINRRTQKFRELDDDSIRRLADKSRNEEEYIFKAREEIAEQEKLLREDQESEKAGSS